MKFNKTFLTGNGGKTKMKFNKSFLIGLLSTTILTSCSNRTSYEEFRTHANTYSNKSHLFVDAEFEIKGTFDGELFNLDIDYDYNQNTKLFVLESGQDNKSDKLKIFSGLLINTKANNIATALKTLGNQDSVNYYTTLNGLKCVETTSDGTKYTLLYNSFGLITKCSAKNNSKYKFNSTFKYSKD